LTWKIEIDKKALKEIAALDKPIQKRVASFLKDKLSKSDNPRSIGEALQGQLKKFWKYRIGDYRLLCSIEDKTVTILVLRVDHRREVYKGK
jgi:mRNA interferase RelE/StbE